MKYVFETLQNFLNHNHTGMKGVHVPQKTYREFHVSGWETRSNLEPRIYRI